MNGIWKEDFCSVFHNHFKCHKTWVEIIFKMPYILRADIWSIDAQNKKKERKKEDGTRKWNYFENFKNRLNPLSTNKIHLSQSLEY